ncbi:quaternary amine ABC transporter ATP-binding protein [Kineosporia babensis]|uniref:Betaine/proline/choline family ABC transporter ATP-binding protein n=1 Tax=Kineosporia babensis TaxID=499548 RepID=A0A9X1NC42_9ACTN|nr:betaine/proline/choline family ABC transporter ATP-binding protein [Kineosporia babensis]MCD5311014.1 betaine/proline/choline family ABC transporter ATP-binding protein [Kineosporia babensis]
MTTQQAPPSPTPPADPTAIRVTGLTKVYGGTQRAAANNVSFDVRPGEFFVIMGLSGSGKSTVLRMLNRLVEPTSGQLSVNGRDVASLRDEELRTLRNRTVNMVFQHFALFPHRTVRENAGYALHVRGTSPAEQAERVDWALRTVGLSDWDEALPGELSGGMRQRVGLARALASDADILLMDEPFSALDPLIRREMQDLLLTLQRDLNRTVVFVTHDLNEAMRLGDRIMIMRDGQVVQLGTAQEILSSPADSYVSEFIADVDRSRVITAETVMREPLLTARLTDSPQDVLRRVSNVEGLGVYVLDSRGQVAGVAHAEQLAAAIGRSRTTLEGCLSDEYLTVAADAPLNDLCSLVGHHVVPLGVIDSEQRLIGVVPRATLLEALAAPGSPEGSDADRKDSHA